MIRYGLAAVTALALSLGSYTDADAARLKRYQLRIINNTSSTILSVYARNLETDDLSGDILSGVISPDDSRVVNLFDGTGTCHFRIQADTIDGRESRKNINVCTTVSLTIH